jgi:hydroxyacylglutathione hydrolase
MSALPHTTLGFERVANPLLRPMEREAFVEAMLSGLPPIPPYYLRMKRLNSDRPPSLFGRRLEALDALTFRTRAQAGATVVDVRPPAVFAAGHIEGSLSIPMRDDVSVWGSWLVPYDRPVLLVAPDPVVAHHAALLLSRVGLDDVAGYLAGGFPAWADADFPSVGTGLLTIAELDEEARGDGLLLDVRSKGEYEGGHVAGAVNVPLPELPERMEGLPNGNRRVDIICASGHRSMIAASLLQAAGRENVRNVTGGMNAWRRQGRPVEA